MSKSPNQPKHEPLGSFTPGPWEAAGASLLAPSGQVAQAFGPTLGESKPNACLIASAPELYSAADAAYGPLRLAALVCGSHDLQGTKGVLEQIASTLESACAKAEGREVSNA